MNERLEKARVFVTRRDNERDKLRQASQPIFASHAQESRGLFSFTATISATVGAFSFLLFDSSVLKSPTLLKFGDFLLLMVIVMSTYSYLSDIEEDSVKYHQYYFDTYEMLSKDINMGYQVLSGEKTFEELEEWAKKQLKVTKYKRPSPGDFHLHWMVFAIFAFALFLIMSSLFICF